MREILGLLITQIRSGWRYRWAAMALAWVVALVGWAAVIQMPDRYKSDARVYVDTESLLRPLLEGLAVQPDIDQRLALMTRTLLSRPNIEHVIRQTDLDLSIRSAEDKERLVQQLQKDIALSAARRRENLYSIGFEHEDPQVAKSVVQTLLTIFVETSLGDSRQQSDTAQKFLDKQIREYEARLVDAENRLTEFKRRNVGTLPGQEGGVFARYQETQRLLQEARLAMQERENLRNELARHLAQTPKTVVERDTAAPVIEAPSPTRERLVAMQTRLDDLLTRYTEAHPSVEELSARVKRLQEELKAEEEARAASAGNRSISVPNPAYDQLQLALGQADAQLAAIQVRTASYEERLQKLQEKMQSLQEVEAELARLDRDYAINKRNYEELVARRESARMSEDIDTVGDSVQFKIIDPPTLPLVPVGPKRVLLSSMALIGALAAGGLLAFILGSLNPVYYDAGALRRQTELPVFGSVSRIWTPELRLKRRLEVGAFITVGLFLVGLFVGVLVIEETGIRTLLVEALRTTV